MRYSPPATETVTYKCEGCGTRHPATARYCDPDYPRAMYTVCSPTCFAVAWTTDAYRWRTQHRAWVAVYKTVLAVPERSH